MSLAVDPRRKRGEQGLEQALTKLALTLESPGSDDLIPFTEALMWLYYLREWHLVRMGGKIAELRKKTDVTDEGKTFFSAVCWARGLDTHGTTDVADLVVNLSSSGILGAGLVGLMVLGSPGKLHWRWVERAILPTSPNDKPHGRDVFYDSFVAGRPILDPLFAAKNAVVGLP